METKGLFQVKVGVLGGGISGEREISLISAREAQQALARNGIDAVSIDITSAFPDAVKRLISAAGVEAAFIALHGEFGEDGQIQSILEEMHIPYTGSPPHASFLTMDKISAKEIFLQKGVPTPSFSVCDDIRNVPEGLRYPLVVKPYFSGSSLGVSIVPAAAYLGDALKKAFAIQKKVVIEEFVDGRELTVGILGDKPLGVVEIVPKEGYYDFHNKYTDGASQFFAPAQLDASVYKAVQAAGYAAHCALGCRHFSRADIRLSRRGVPFVLEVNAIPGLTSHSLLPLSARCEGLSFDDLIVAMASFAVNAKKNPAQKTQS